MISAGSRLGVFAACLVMTARVVPNSMQASSLLNTSLIKNCPATTSIGLPPLPQVTTSGKLLANVALLKSIAI